jgi:hypothetical protein
MERRIEEERARVEAEYRRVLKSSVEFERRIRDRWRRKCRAKNERIADLEARVAELERRLGEKARQENAPDPEFRERGAETPPRP